MEIWRHLEISKVNLSDEIYLGCTDGILSGVASGRESHQLTNTQKALHISQDSYGIIPKLLSLQQIYRYPITSYVLLVHQMKGDFSGS